MENCCLCKHQVFFYTQVRVAVHINFVNAFQKQLLVEYCLGMNHHIAYITRCKENYNKKMYVVKLTVYVDCLFDWHGNPKDHQPLNEKKE